MLNLEKIQNDFNRGQMSITDIGLLIAEVAVLRKEKEALLEDNKEIRQAHRRLRKKTTFKVFEENLSLAIKNKQLQEQLEALTPKQ